MRTKLEIASEFAPREALEACRSFFLVGIGGAGMSGIARMLARRGYRVRGTDSTRSDVTDQLESLGIEVWIGHSGDFVSSDDVLVLTDAIDLNLSPEVRAARALGLKLFRRSQVLGWLLRDHKVVAVTGTHGKTTTASMIGVGLQAAGLDPTIVIGAEVPQFGSAVVEGGGEIAVVEACEAYDSFHDLDPFLVVLTNLELDHLDFHESWEGLRDSVNRFVSRVQEGGALIYAAADSGAQEIADQYPGTALGYGSASLNDLMGGASHVPEMALPGEHNRLNAAGAVLAIAQLGADPRAAMAGIAQFRGAQRRLQILRDGPITVIDDYAHHPSEITASLSALRERYGDGRIVVVYQPHLYSRTRDFMDEFAPALSLADVVVLTDIYPAREAPLAGISSARILEQITKPAHYVPSRHLLPRFVKDLVQEGDVIVGMGAGNIDAFAPQFLQELDRSGPKRIAVISGGDSAEREVSKHSGRAIAQALRNRDYLVEEVDVTELLLAGGSVERFSGPNRPDLAFLAVHGTHAEDGAIQGFFELLHIPYTGPNIQSSSLAMDKDLTKTLLRNAGLPVPEGVLLRPSDPIQEAPIPAIVKPNSQGSTVGLKFVHERAELEEAVRYARQFGEDVLLEEWVEGIEISVPVHQGRALPPVEIVPASGQYDFASKYLPGATEEICPARIPEAQIRLAEEYAVRAHEALRCRGATRTDMIVASDRIVILEVNTLPGMTPTSLLPRSAAEAGISFDDLCEQIVEEALSRNASR